WMSERNAAGVVCVQCGVDEFPPCASHELTADNRQWAAGVLHESLGAFEIARRLARRCDDAGVTACREVNEPAETFLRLIVDDEHCLMQVERVGLGVEHTVRNSTRENARARKIGVSRIQVAVNGYTVCRQHLG